MGRDPLSPTNFIFLLANGKILPRRRPATLLPWHFVPFNWIKKDYTPTVLIPTPRAPHMVSSDPRPHHFGPGLVRDVTPNVSVQGGLLSLPPEIPFIADPSQVDPRQQSVASLASIRYVRPCARVLRPLQLLQLLMLLFSLHRISLILPCHLGP
jgi:hypothetical protein